MQEHELPFDSTDYIPHDRPAENGSDVTESGIAPHQDHALSDSVPATLAERLPDECPVHIEDFRIFARQNGYSQRRASAAWQMILNTASAEREVPEVLGQYYPPIQLLRGAGPNDTPALDLRSVYYRLAYSFLLPEAWAAGNSDGVRFLARLINGILNPQVQLPLTRHEAMHTDALLSPTLRSEIGAYAMRAIYRA